MDPVLHQIPHMSDVIEGEKLSSKANTSDMQMQKAPSQLHSRKWVPDIALTEQKASSYPMFDLMALNKCITIIRLICVKFGQYVFQSHHGK